MLDLLPNLQVLIVPEPLWHYLDVNGINKSELLSTEFLLRENGIENSAMLLYVNSLYNSPDFKNKFDFAHYPETYKYPTPHTSSIDFQQLQNRVEGMKLEGKDFYEFFPTTVNTFRPFMISERVVGLIPVIDLESAFKQRLDGFFGVLRTCNVPVTLLAKLPYFKQHVQEALETTTDVNVSQESITISSVLGGIFMAGALVVKVIKMIEKRRDKTNLKTKELEAVNDVVEQAKRTLIKLSKATTTNSTVSAPGFFLGSPKGKDASGIITHLKTKVILPTTKLLDKLEKQFHVLRELDTEWDASDDDPEVEEKIDKESSVMTQLIKSVINRGLIINGLNLSINANGKPERDPEYNPDTKPQELSPPSEKQFDEVAELLGTLIELYIRCKGIPVSDYAQAETFWIRDVEQMLEDTVKAFITYLDNSVN